MTHAHDIALEAAATVYVRDIVKYGSDSPGFKACVDSAKDEVLLIMSPYLTTLLADPAVVEQVANAMWKVGPLEKNIGALPSHYDHVAQAALSELRRIVGAR